MGMDAYACVTAGLADGIALEELLAHLGIGARRWAQGRRYWDTRLLDSMGDGPAFSLQFEGLQLLARKKWQRRIEPIESDLCAWLAFERYCMQVSDPHAYLAGCGITIGEVGRVAQQWTERLAADGSVREQVLAIRAEPSPLREIALEISDRPRLAPAAAEAADSDVGRVEDDLDKDDDWSLPPPSLLSDLPPPAAAAPEPKPPDAWLGRFGMGGGIDKTGDMPKFEQIKAAAGLPSGNGAVAAAPTDDARLPLSLPPPPPPPPPLPTVAGVAPEPPSLLVLSPPGGGDLFTTGPLNVAVVELPFLPFAPSLPAAEARTCEPTEPLEAVAAKALELHLQQARREVRPARKAKPAAAAPASDMQRLGAALRVLNVGPAVKGGRRYSLALFAALMITTERATPKERQRQLKSFGLTEQTYQKLCDDIPSQLHSEALRLIWAAYRQCLASKGQER